MIYHFLPQGIYAAQFIDFMRNNKEVLLNSHIFLFLSHGETEINNSFSTVDCKNVYSFFSVLKIFLLLKKDDRIIIHNYSHPYLYLAAACVWWKLKHIVWKIWGGDLYWHDSVKKGKYKIYEIFRKFTIKRFGYISTDEFEYELVKSYYSTKGKNIFTLYPRTFFDVPVQKRKDYIAVLVGNSRDPSNEHLEALNLLSRFKSENIKIFIPLSYGDCPDGYIEKIDCLATDLFDEKYVPIKNIMSLKDYCTFLSTIDIMLCNHRRQQGWGNLLVVLHQKKKVFIRKGISTVDDFNSYGLKFYLTNDIEKMSFSEFKEFSVQNAETNHSILTAMFSKENLILIWNNLFKTIIKE